MQLEKVTGLTGLRFDNDLRTFPELMELYLNPVDKNRILDKKAVVTGPLSPVDMIYAAGAVAFDVNTHSTLQSIFNGHSNLSQKAVDAQISPEISPWNLVMLGSILSGQDSITADMFSTAFGGFDDQLIKSFQAMAKARSKPLYFWEIPRHDIESETWALNYLEQELKRLFEWLSAHTGQKITEESLRNAICSGNLLRRDLCEIDTYLAMKKVPIAGLEYYLVQAMLGDYARNPEGLHKLLRQLIDELQIRVDEGKAVPGISDTPVRIYVMGDETQELHLYNAIENYGGVVVGCDFRFSLYYNPIDENGKPLESLTRWIWNMPSNLPTKSRIKLELEYIQKQKPDAVIINSVVGSRHLPGVEKLVRYLIKQELNIPMLSIETTLPGENRDKIDYQTNALLQTIVS